MDEKHVPDGLAELLDKARKASKGTRIDWRNPIAAHGLAAIDRLEPWLADPELGTFAALTIERAAASPETILAAKAVLRAGRRQAPWIVAEDIADVLDRLNRRSRPGGHGDRDGSDEPADLRETFLDLHDLLVARARQRRLVSYNETGYTRNVIGPLLDELNRAEHAAGRPLLSAIVVHKGTRMPGDGFFDLAYELRLFDPAKDRSRFAHDEQERVFAFWAPKDEADVVVAPITRSDSGLRQSHLEAHAIARSPLRAVSAPGPLLELVATWRREGSPVQPAIPWPRDAWIQAFPEHAQFLGTLPLRMCRDDVRRVGALASASEERAIEAFLATMAWGFGRIGYAQTRVSGMLTTPSCATKLRRVAVALEGSDGAARAYALFSDCGPSRIAGLGPSFATKYLHFCQPRPADGPMALIHDSVISKWLEAGVSLPLGSDGFSTVRYRLYLGQMAAWAEELECEPDEIEMVIFRSMQGASSQWS